MGFMIDLKHLKKSFYTDSGVVKALDDVSLCIESGEIYGVVGFSGAGKSTLVRCVNLLERPESGSVMVDGHELTTMNEKQLCRARQDIGMIFQHFNLLESMTVFDNIAFPLRYLRINKRKIRERVSELLSLVDLTEKEKAYPSQLSGGQKQRVAIARALATNPKVLLSDEATSALDPQTTESILQLLQKLNRQLNLTIMMITHEMDVVKEVCDKIAVMENGRIVESRRSYDLFTDPQTEIGRRFASSVFSTTDLKKILTTPECVERLKGRKLYHLLYVNENSLSPTITQAAVRFGVEISIVCGNIEVLQNRPVGSLFVAIRGDEDSVLRTTAFFAEQGVKVRRLEEGGVIDV